MPLGFYSLDGKFIKDPKAVVPLLSHDEAGWNVVGTGFYISHQGIIVTAKHCIEEGGTIASKKPHCVFHWDLEKEDQFLMRPILRAWACPISDIAVLLAAPMHHKEKGHPIPTQALMLSIERPPPGTGVASYAYPNTRMDKDGTSTTIRLEPKLVRGRLMDYFPAGRDRSMINWPVYETDMEIGRGCSGGPVFGEGGTVFAVNTSSLEVKQGEPQVSYITPVDYILDAVISNVSLGEGSSPNDFSIRQLAQQGWIKFKPPFPTRATSK